MNVAVVDGCVVGVVLCCVVGVAVVDGCVVGCGVVLCCVVGVVILLVVCIIVVEAIDVLCFRDDVSNPVTNQIY